MQANHRNALKPGHRLLWYRIDRILGQGGFGITYLGTDTNLDQRVAIKEYLPMELAVREGDHSVHPASQAQEDGFTWGLDRFLSEARTLAKFDHPSIVRVLSVFEEHNTAYMVMRFEEGRSLQEIIAREQLSEGQLTDIAGALLQGLAIVHAAGFIHRDIKPANIYIRADGTPVLLDFGSARQSVGAQTRTLTSLVSPGFAPFEQYYAKSDQQGPWTDLYGLGATLYRSVTGKPPADALARGEALLKKQADTLEPAAVLAAPGYSPGFLAAIDKALRFAVDERPQNAQEWRADFGAAETAAGAPAVAGTAPPTAKAESEIATELAQPCDHSSREAFLGSHNAEYYRRRFKRFDGQAAWRRASWLWPAALCTFAWLLYRRMYVGAFLGYPVVVAVTAVAASFLASLITAGQLPGFAYGLIVLAIAVLLPGFFAGAVYHARANRLVDKVGKRGLDEAQALTWLASKGGVSRTAPVVGFAALFGLALLLAGLPKGPLLPSETAQAPLPEHGAAVTDQAAPPPPPQTDEALTDTLPETDGAPTDVAAEAPLQPMAQAEASAQEQPDPIAELLEGAGQDVAEGRLITPPGDNAAEKYHQVLEHDPDNVEAISGLRSMAGSYLAKAKSVAAEGRHGQALNILKNARKVAPQADELTEILLRTSKQLGAHAAENRNRRAARQYLNFALMLAPDDPELRRFKRRFQKARDRRQD